MDAELHLRAVQAEDANLLLRWANDPLTRGASFESGTIELEQHQIWLKGKLACESTSMYILQRGGQALGTVRFEQQPGQVELSYQIAPEFRGRRLGQQMLLLGMERWRQEHGRQVTFLARTKPSNLASLRTLARLHFSPRALEAEPGQLLLWREFD